MKIRIDYFLMYLIFGPRWKEKIWMSKKDKRELADQILVSTTPVLSEKWDLHPINVEIEAEYPCFNPSIVKFNDGYRLIIRSTNVINLNDGDYQYLSNPHQTRNFVVELNDKFEIVAQNELDNNLGAENIQNVQYGIDDLRIFRWCNALWVCGAVPYLQEGKTETCSKQIFCKLDDNQLSHHKIIESPYNRKVEKNWVPIVRDDKLTIACSLDPLDLMHFVNGEFEHSKFMNKTSQEFKIRGGTPFILWKNVLLGVVHSAHIHHKGKRYYTHHFVILNKELKVIEISEPFFIQRKGIEFASGLELYDEGVILSYGIADRACRILKVPNAIIAKYITW